jgi:hypothetical protein
MPLTYRRARGSDIWHFRVDCSEWPEFNFDQQSRTPSDGFCCVECTYWPSVDLRAMVSARLKARAGEIARAA